jgi:LytTr DNA-binding domain
MEALTHTLEKACVLVTLMFVLGRTGFVARLAGPSPSAGYPPRSGRWMPRERQDPLLALAIFTLMALTEFWIAAHQPTLLNVRFVATRAVGLLAGRWIGLAIAVIAGVLAFGLANASLAGYVLPLVAWGHDRLRDVARLLARHEIVAVVRRGRRTWIHTADAEYPSYYPVARVAAWLGGAPFLRAAREAVVHREAVAAIIHHGERLYHLRLKDRRGTIITVSRSGARCLASLLKPHP